MRSIRLPPFFFTRRTRGFLRSLKSRLPDRAMSSFSSSPAQQPQSPPPFNPSQPSVPISYPIKTLADLESCTYFESFHFPFNRASVKLPAQAAEMPARRRILVCHDMQGGYVDDKWVQGGRNDDAYAIWHWYLMDVFVYFSHELVTLPPPCWTNAAHTHGVKVLGTFIAEYDSGSEICKTLLATKQSARLYAERLAELAAALGFDGWLLNMEVNLDLAQISNLKEFVNHLTRTMHSQVSGSLVIWYDAVTKDGHLDWQDQLNEKNKPFFDLCDGIFVNYTWKKDFPKLSAEVAGDRRYDVYMGIDVFGRNTFGGGKWKTNVALDVLRDDDISAAIFAPGWVYETKQEPDFQTAQNRWWGLVEKSWGVLQSYPKELPFYSNFDQGHGFHFSVEGSQVAIGPWNNISNQGFQPLLDSSMDPLQVLINFDDVAYSGGGYTAIKGNLTANTSYSTRLFQGQLPCGDLPLHISYSVKSDEKYLLGISLKFSSNSNHIASILLVNNLHTLQINKLQKEYSRIILPQVKKYKKEVSNPTWIHHEASIELKDDHILTEIGVVCYMEGKLENIEQETEGPYNASLGHISIRNTGQNTDFPPASSWFIEGQHISWDTSSTGTRTVSFLIIWSLKTGDTAPFVKYNIYVEKQRDNNLEEESSFLGVARVQAFYVSDLEVPTDVWGLRFIVQACGLDGCCQELELCPAYILVAPGQ